MDTDFLLAVLKRMLPAHPGVKLILMSATMESSLFAKYFAGVGDGSSKRCGGRRAVLRWDCGGGAGCKSPRWVLEGWGLVCVDGGGGGAGTRVHMLLPWALPPPPPHRHLCARTAALRQAGRWTCAQPLCRFDACGCGRAFVYCHPGVALAPAAAACDSGPAGTRRRRAP